MTEEEIREILDEYLDELEAVLGYASGGNSDLRDQFAYSDPVTGLSYEVFYDFNVDTDQAVVAYALLGGEKVRLNRDLRQRMTQAAFEDWLKGFNKEAVEAVPGAECAFKC